MMDRASTIIITYFFSLIATGCGSTAPSHFYTLSATTEKAAPASTLSVAVGPVSIPALVDRPEIVVSTSENQVSLDEFNRWASPLEDNLGRVIAANLATLLGTPRVSLFPQTLSGDTDYRVTIEVQRFESTPGKSALLDAVWTVRRTVDGNNETGRTTLPESVADASYDALAAAHSRAVGKMSYAIATAIRNLERSRPIAAPKKD